MVDKVNIQEAGASEGSLTPGGGTAAGDIRVKTIADIVAAMGSMSHEDLNHFKQSLTMSVEAGRRAGEGNGHNMASIKSSGALKTMVKEDLAKIFGGEETLSETFIDSATTLFEAAVTTRVAIEEERLNEEFEQRLEEATEDFVVKSTERLDTYLDYFADQFMEENRIAVEAGVRVDLAESFLQGLETLFTEHNVSIPSDQVDVLAALEEENQELRAALNEAIDENAIVASAIAAHQIEDVVNDLSEGMTDTDRARFLLVAESVDYDTTEQLVAKLTAVRDTLFEAAPLTEGSGGLMLEEVQAINEQGFVVEEPTIKNPAMSHYVSAISRHKRS